MTVKVTKSQENIYLRNPNLKAAGVKVSFTTGQLQEYIKCSQDPIYFIKTYMKIVHLDRGVIPFELWPFQEDMVRLYHNNRFSIVKCARQVGKTSTTIGYLLWYALFNSDANLAILANKGGTARDILGRIKFAYEFLPKWLQQGVVVWNKGNIELDNNSKIIAAATSSSAIRGSSYSIILLDEFAHVQNSVQNEFFQSVYPTITSGKTTKVIIISTPKGMNLFYKIWTDAVEGRNLYKPFEAGWNVVPGRDQKWKEDTIANIGQDKWLEEFECTFQGSANTLIAPSTLQAIVYRPPINKLNDVDIHAMPEKDRVYVLSCDVAHGAGMDYSAFVVIDTTEFPYKVVAKYYNNKISPVLLPSILYNTAKLYNQAMVIIEVNDVGNEVAKILFDELEYSNILFTAIKGRAGQVLGSGAAKASQYGVKMTKQVKRIGCAVLKNLIEDKKLEIADFDIIYELASFVFIHNTYEADEGCHDDLCMALVIFAWMSAQPYFNQLMNRNFREQLFKDKMKDLEDEVLPFFADHMLENQYTENWNLF